MSDLTINVRQVGSYPQAEVGADDLVLLQQGGLGGPYYTTTPLGFLQPLEDASLGVGFAVPDDAGPGNIFAGPHVLPIDSGIHWNVYGDDSGQDIHRYWQTNMAASIEFEATTGFVLQIAPVGQADSPTPDFIPVLTISLAGAAALPLGTLTVARDPVNAMEVATANWVGANTVASFNGRRGIVHLWEADIYAALGYSSRLATEAWVCGTINATILGNFVLSFNGRNGAVVLTADDISKACLAPLAEAETRTPPPEDRSFKITNTAWVLDFLYGKFWQDLQTNFVPDLSGYAPINSPNFTGIPTAPQPSFGTSNAQIPTCNWVNNAINVALIPIAPVNNPSFTGIPTGPTANPGTATAQLATTSFVMAAITSATTGVISWNNRTGAVELEASDINDAGGALLNSPSFTGTPTVPMAPGGSSSDQIASTAWVLSEIAAISAGVTSWNGRSGIVTLQASDLTAVGAALLASPAFTGAPTAPTATLGTNSTQLATTAFVIAQLNALQYVGSFNGRSGVVTLTANDISAAGGLANPSPALTGTPTTPTAIPGTNTTQIASTAFVQAALSGLTGIYVGLTPPASPGSGQGWFNMNDAQLYVWNGTVWVIAVNPPSPDLANYVTQAGPSTINQALINQPQIMGVTDGSNAPAGAVGEFQSWQFTGNSAASGAWGSIYSFSLPAGDWDVRLFMVVTNTGAAISRIAAMLSLTSNSGAALAGYGVNYIPFSTAVQQWNGVIDLYRVSGAAAQTLYANININFTGGTNNVTVYATARRVR